MNTLNLEALEPSSTELLKALARLQAVGRQHEAAEIEHELDQRNPVRALPDDEYLRLLKLAVRCTEILGAPTTSTGIHLCKWVQVLEGQLSIEAVKRFEPYLWSWHGLSELKLAPLMAGVYRRMVVDYHQKLADSIQLPFLPEANA